MQAFDYGGGIDVVPMAEDTHQMRVYIRHLQLCRPMHFVGFFLSPRNCQEHPGNFVQKLPNNFQEHHGIFVLESPRNCREHHGIFEGLVLSPRNCQEHHGIFEGLILSPRNCQEHHGIFVHEQF